MIEVTKVLKRKNKRYIYVNVTPSKTITNSGSQPLFVRIYRCYIDGVMKFDPYKWGVEPVEETELTEGLTYSFRLRFEIPDGINLEKYEVGLVKEGVSWCERLWLEN